MDIFLAPFVGLVALIVLEKYAAPMFIKMLVNRADKETCIFLDPRE